MEYILILLGITCAGLLWAIYVLWKKVKEDKLAFEVMNRELYARIEALENRIDIVMDKMFELYFSNKKMSEKRYTQNKDKIMELKKETEDLKTNLESVRNEIYEVNNSSRDICMVRSNYKADKILDIIKDIDDIKNKVESENRIIKNCLDDLWHFKIKRYPSDINNLYKKIYQIEDALDIGVISCRDCRFFKEENKQYYCNNGRDKSDYRLLPKIKRFCPDYENAD